MPAATLEPRCRVSYAELAGPPPVGQLGRVVIGCYVAMLNQNFHLAYINPFSVQVSALIVSWAVIASCTCSRTSSWAMGASVSGIFFAMCEVVVSCYVAVRTVVLVFSGFNQFLLRFARYLEEHQRGDRLPLRPRRLSCLAGVPRPCPQWGAGEASRLCSTRGPLQGRLWLCRVGCPRQAGSTTMSQHGHRYLEQNC